MTVLLHLISAGGGYQEMTCFTTFITLPSKIPLLEQARTGIVHDHHRQLLAMQLAHIDFLDEQIEALTRAIVASLKALSTAEPPREDPPPLPAVGSAPSVAASPPLPFTRAVELLDTIPGIDQRGAEVMVAEI